MDSMYDTETAQEYTSVDCLDSTLKLLPEEVLVEYTRTYSQDIKNVRDYLSSLFRNLTDESIQSFSSYPGYSDETKFRMSGILSSLNLVSAPIPVIPWTVVLSTNNDVLHLFRANFAHQAHASRLMNRIGEVYTVPDIPWYDVDIVYDKEINTLGNLFLFS